MNFLLCLRRYLVLEVFTLNFLIVLLIPSAEAEFISALSRCPRPCRLSGLDPATWTYYHDLQVLKTCKETILFQTNLYNAVNDSRAHIGFRACTTRASLQAPEFIQDGLSNSSWKAIHKQQGQNPLAPLSWGLTNANVDADSASSAIAGLATYAKSNSTGSSVMLSHRDKAVAGFYIGPGIDVKSAVAVIDAFAATTAVRTTRRAVQWCGSGNDTAANRQSFGLILDTQGSVASVQYALSRWASGSCLRGDVGDDGWWSAISPTISTTLASSGFSTSSNSTAVAPHRFVSARDTCRYVQVQSGDGCWALVQRCGITQDQLQSYNGGASFCNNLQVGQYVCCSPGTPPNFSPKPSNGNCYPYTVQAGDTCADIAKANQMQASGIENNNALTWGWMGCKNLQIGQKICLSSGNPPFPATVASAVCGPQVNGTAATSDPKTWANLNQCPLNACCDIWGQCGITSEFCTPSPSDTGAPGTAQPGSNGCISNCGTDMVRSAPPDSFIRIGYFEGWNDQRPCLNMWPNNTPSKYTHVHFAFANISSSFDVDIGTVGGMFNQFKATVGFKHILSFGGWAFSTAPATYPIFRQGVTSAQRQTFANNVANFIKNNQLDGVDFDWEYPGAPDIPGIPPGNSQDGANYLEFLKMVRVALPPQYSISIAAPASYWYLKGFPIADMNQVVDYVVYMTYDLHGQWDYGNAFSDPGCPSGNCLRSHVNRTEIQQALSMITKAGVESRKVIVGQALYGRSFQMGQAGCYTEMCTFTGPLSGAKPGKCTGTAGYISNWEIQQILDNPTSNTQQYYSPDAGDILVYDDTQWVSYMSDQTYDNRLNWIQGLGFGGAVDWAMDLGQSYYGNGTEVGTGSGVVYIDPSVLKDPQATIACQPPCTFVFPRWTLSTAITISPPPITSTVLNMYPSIQTLSDGITSTVYVSVTTVTTLTLPPLTTNVIDVWNVKWTDTKQSVIYLTSSVIFPPKVFTQSPSTVTTGTKTTILAGVPFTYSPGPFPSLPTTSQAPPPPPPPPPPFTIASVKVTSGSPQPTCVPGSAGCGSLCKKNCSPPFPCFGVCGCIGVGCPSGGSCFGPGCDGGDDGDGSDHDRPKQSCSTTRTVTNCQVACSVTNFGTSTASICYSTQCVTVQACSPTGSTTTSRTTAYACPWTTALAGAKWSPSDTAALPPALGGGGAFGYTFVTGSNAPLARPATRTIACEYHGPDPHNGVTARYCVCSSSTFPASSNTQNPGQWCAYVTKPAQTTSIYTIKSSTTSNCVACIYAGDNAQCTTVAGCTPVTTTTLTTTTHPTVTVTVTPTADCKFGDEGWGNSFLIYNIRGWATDGGRSLKNEEKGCSVALTGWEWHGPTPDDYPYVRFNMPFFFKDGCIERAIVSAGGPKIKCLGEGIDWKKKKRTTQRQLLSRFSLTLSQLWALGLQPQSDAGDGSDSEGPAPLVPLSQVLDNLTQSKHTQIPTHVHPTSTPPYTYASSRLSGPHGYVPAAWTGSGNSSAVVVTTTISDGIEPTVTTTAVAVRPTSGNKLLNANAVTTAAGADQI